ncbi:MAG: NADH-quinone oxidoreductase subunit K [Deltaproteobacteria bacterium]|jgi:NADH:ubiquinone oxidoreductase subunit K
MNGDLNQLFGLFLLFLSLLLIAGVYLITATRNLIRILIGMEIMTKAVTLLIIAAGYVTANIALAQSIVITLIIVEVVVLLVGAGIVVGVFMLTGDISVKALKNMRG